jgi:hypothetical protein
MEYFCYISRSKVDQLFQSFGFEDIDEITETKTSEQKIESSANLDLSFARIIDLFKAGVTYGRAGTLQREKKIKTTYVMKLHQVLREINKEQTILSFTKSLPLSNPEPTLYRWYQHKGFFRVEKPIESATSDKIISIYTDVLSRKLLLDCSLRFFSEGNAPDGTFAINSSNSRFFDGTIPLQFETIFMVLGQKGNDFIGTPLFLLLSGDDSEFRILI